MRNTKRKRLKDSLPILVLSLFILLGAGGTAGGESAGKLVEKGNAAYTLGRYDKALAAYKEAGTKAPESPRIFFNTGTAYYRKGDYAKAAEAFKKAAAKSRDAGLEARAKFNLGNSLFRESERRRGGDLRKSLAACEKSIYYYREALKLRPGFRKAAENLEIVRLTLKSLLDQVKKQEDARKKRREAMKKLRDLIKKQEDAANRTRALAGSGKKGKNKDLARAQRDIRKETRDLAGKLAQGKPPDPAKKHLQDAAREQGSAVKKLEKNQTGEAVLNQERAAGELREAFKALNAGKHDRRGKGQGKHPSSRKQKSSSPRKGVRPEKGRNERPKAGQGKDQPPMAALTDEARDILREEKENRRRRRLPVAGGYRPVNKDW